jgi:hypothetical protein
MRKELNPNPRCLFNFFGKIRKIQRLLDNYGYSDDYGSGYGDGYGYGCGYGDGDGRGYGCGYGDGGGYGMGGTSTWLRV